jgi:GNAT superfamily N-acetyltransferase
MVSDFLIRRAVAADREAVQTIAAAGMREFGLEPDFADLDRLGDGRPGVVAKFVAEVDHAICGSAILSVRAAGVGKLSGLYVNSACRGRGMGRALLQAAFTAGMGSGLARLYLQTWGRMSAAVRLYESAGWARGADPPAGSGADRSYWLELGHAQSVPAADRPRE